MFNLFGPSKQDLKDEIKVLQKVIKSQQEMIEKYQKLDSKIVSNSIKPSVKNGDVPIPGVDY